jgi:hypothetical protein
MLGDIILFYTNNIFIHGDILFISKISNSMDLLKIQNLKNLLITLLYDNVTLIHRYYHKIVF